MTITGIKQIGFIEPNEVNDQWAQQEQQARGIPNVYLDGTHRFDSIDQGAATLSEKSSISEHGRVYDIELSFVVRTPDDIALGKKYINRPLLLHVWAVDGSHYIIGTKSYPAFIENDNTYSGTENRELAMTVKYQSKIPILT